MNLTAMDSRSDLRSQVGDAIRNLRAARAMTQADVAGFVNIRAATLSDIERGVNLPDLETLVNIAALFGATVDQILGGSTPPAPVGDEVERLGRTVGLLQAGLEKALEKIGDLEGRLQGLETAREAQPAPRRKGA